MDSIIAGTSMYIHVHLKAANGNRQTHTHMPGSIEFSSDNRWLQKQLVRLAVNTQRFPLQHKGQEYYELPDRKKKKHKQ